jgi:hypothetical protein
LAIELRPRPGDYYSTDHELYRVERVVDDRVLLEDCMTEALVDMPLEELFDLRPVKRSPQAV